MKKIFAIIASAVLVGCTASNEVLNNKTYTLTELNGTEYVAVEQPATISFAEGRCNAYLGGNQIFALYSEGKNGKISFSECGQTRMFVPEELREDEFVAAFNTVARFEVEDNTITFFNAEGEPVFKAVE